MRGCMDRLYGFGGIRSTYCAKETVRGRHSGAQPPPSLASAGSCLGVLWGRAFQARPCQWNAGTFLAALGQMTFGGP